MNKMYKSLARLILALGLCLSIFAGFSQNTLDRNGAADYRIGITTGSFVPEATGTTGFRFEEEYLYDGKYFYLLQLYEIPSEEIRKGWEAGGLVLTDYLPGNVWYAVIDQSFDINIMEHDIRAIFPVDKRFKQESQVYYKGVPEHAIVGGGMAKMTVSYYASLDGASVLTALVANGLEIESHRPYSRQVDVVMEVQQLNSITSLPYIQFIGAWAGEPVLEGEDHNNSTGRTNYLNTGYNGLNYNGSGVVIAVGEDGTVDNIIDARGRLTEMTTGSPASHKIGVMRYAAGAGNTDPSNRNNAWGVSLLSTPVSTDYSGLYSSHSLRYTNHSFGYPIGGGYDLAARNHDLRIAALPNHLVIYSAGNSGDQIGYSPYSFLYWGNITGEVKHNKNQFAIGALSPNDALKDFSSRGPMYDGRIIPQLAIEGNGGTSNAAPKITGNLAILAQIYKDKNSGAEPASSLLRAILMNTADDLENSGPDFKTGYGRPNMRRAYNAINSNQFLTGSVSNSGTNTHNISVPTNTKQVKVMIVWPDMAAAVNANPAIVNNLNLQATDPSSNTYNPWILDHTANPANLDMPATRGVDNINTIEQVTVDNPAAGIWSISVNGANVPAGPQTYYLAYEFLMDELYMAFPLENHKFISGETYYLRWDSYGGTGTFSLDYRVAGGSWTSIVAGYDASSRVYSWIAPTVTSIETIEFRVRRGSLTSTSGVNYIGGVPENFRVFKVCNDVVTLKWSPVSGATSYKVYKLGTQHMEEVTSNITFTGSSAVLTGQSTVNTEFYAVSALTDTYEGQRTNAIAKAPGDYGCVAISWTGANSTDWFDGGNWSSGVPTCADNITIPASAANQPVINSTGATCGTITIESGASLTMDGSTAYTLSVCGDWINNGTFSRGIGIIQFVGTSNYQEISGSSTTAFNILRVSKGARDRILEATSLITLNGSTNPLDLVSGTFKLSSNSIIAPFTTSKTIDGLMGLWNNGGTINSGSFSWTLNGTGLLRISGGTTNVGTNAGNGITYLNNPTIIIEGGALNVAGRISPNGDASTANYTQHGGTVTVMIVGTTITTRAAFEMTTNVSFTMTGGAIVIRRANSSFSSDYRNSSTAANITGGTLQIGNASTPASQAIRINSTVPVYNLVINAQNSPIAQLVTSGLTVKNNIIIAGGILDANNLDINIGGSWTNNGTFSPGTGTVTFNGTQPQDLGGTTATSFNNLTLNNSEGLTLSGSTNTTVEGVLTLANGLLVTGSNILVVSNDATGAASGGSASAYVQGNLQRAIAAGANTYHWPIGTATAYALAGLDFASGTAAGTLKGFAADGDHPQIASSDIVTSKSVNRYWDFSVLSGLTIADYNAAFSWVPADEDAAFDYTSAKVGKYSGSAWTYPTIGTRTANSIEITGESGFSSFQIGNFDVPCINPADFGTIAGAQTFCSSGDPVAFTNTTGPSGHTGTLEYKWQSSTTSNSTGFNDIASTNSDVYDASTVTQTTWFRRLARVDCMPDWTGAAASNVLEITVNQPSRRYATVLGAGAKDGLSWGSAYDGTQLQSAINESCVNEVWVAKGIYKPTVQVGGTGTRFQTFQMKNGVAIYGGFAGTESLVSERADYGEGGANETILSGDLNGDDNYTNNPWTGIAENCYHVFYHPLGLNLNTTAVLDGFTISGGNADSGYDPHYLGGGMYNYGSSPKLNNITFQHNAASQSYGGGGAIYMRNSSPMATNITLQFNTSYYGGGIYLQQGCEPSFTNWLISNNYASGRGGGVYNANIYAIGYNNATITTNHAVDQGGGIYSASAPMYMRNCIIWGNYADNPTNKGNQIFNSSGLYVTMDYCCFANGAGDIFPTGGLFTWDANTIQTDPLFADAANGDYRLFNTSPCTDAGNNSYNALLNDIRGGGFGRKLLKTDYTQSGIIDMGAYEYNSNTDPVGCTNPAAGGTIAAAQTVCSGDDPAAFTSSALPTGHQGTLEYQWQYSTTESPYNFNDIPGATSTVYDAPSVTQTTWYQRVAKVDCMAGWSGAIASNVLKVTVNSLPTFTYTTSDISCFSGSDGIITINASGGSGSGYEYSIDGGSTWYSSHQFTGLISGNYILQVKDSNGCLQINGTP